MGLGVDDSYLSLHIISWILGPDLANIHMCYQETDITLDHLIWEIWASPKLCPQNSNKVLCMAGVMAVPSCQFDYI